MRGPKAYYTAQGNIFPCLCHAQPGHIKKIPSRERDCFYALHTRT